MFHCSSYSGCISIGSLLQVDFGGCWGELRVHGQRRRAVSQFLLPSSVDPASNSKNKRGGKLLMRSTFLELDTVYAQSHFTFERESGASSPIWMP